MRILFFGRLRDTAGAHERRAPEHIASLAELRAWIDAEDPALGEVLRGKGVRVAINKTVVFEETQRLNPRDEVAFMPPLSGG